jgi:hypothetical protein
MVLRSERCTLWLFQDISAQRHRELELVEAIETVMKDASWSSRSIMDKLTRLRNPRSGEGAKEVIETVLFGDAVEVQAPEVRRPGRRSACLALASADLRHSAERKLSCVGPYAGGQL